MFLPAAGTALPTVRRAIAEDEEAREFLEELGLKRDHDDRHFQLVQLSLPVPQLRHVLPARQSPQVPVEHQQQPAARVV